MSPRSAKKQKSESGLPTATATAESKEKEGESGFPTATATAESKKEAVEPWNMSGVVGLSMRWDQRRPGCPKATKCMKFTGDDYLTGFKPDPNYNYHTDTNSGLIPKGALPEHRPHFSDIWFRYDTQLHSTNGMDLDTYPGCSMLTDSVPVVLSPNTHDYALAMELINLALEIYNNDDSNVFKYKFLKIEKVNLRLTGYLLFFMTVKFVNVTLGTVVETFQIYAGRSNCRPHIEVFSCVPKAGALI